MAGLVSELIAVLEEQVSEYEKLISASTEKKQAIINNDIDGVKAGTGAEQAHVGKIQRLERKRAGIMKDIATVLNEKLTNITIIGVAETMKSSPDGKTLTDLAHQLRALADELKTLNNSNSALIENALAYIDFSVNVMRSTYELSAGYGQNGELVRMDGGTLLDEKN